ncbi:NAD-dependent epimerase/dehydratase family protein [Dasania marina]|uniref:NAD-dependent epimerase/dehydratase family protein n=1 Tax=Dasania marina TaxID=471499 RepID=UPI0030D8907B|tara:strand:+ start:69671 stop:70504 length:834 start_codon:yes stop_codon:yes gene_type:complete
MKTLILGGSGFIGSAVCTELQQRGAELSLLCRSPRSTMQAENLGATVIRGDISAPMAWCKQLAQYDAVIHMACGFDHNMAEIDKNLIQALITGLSSKYRQRSLLYTGGTWCYPNSPKAPLNEQTPFSPLPMFAWLQQHSQQVCNSEAVRGICLHPGIVTDDPDHIPELLKQEFASTGRVAMPCTNDLIWPLVDRQRLAKAYYLALDRAPAGEHYNVAEIEAQPVFELAKKLAQRHAVDTDIEIKTIDYWTQKYGAYCQGFERSQNLSSAKIRDHLGW